MTMKTVKGRVLWHIPEKVRQRRTLNEPKPSKRPGEGRNGLYTGTEAQ